MIRIKNLYKTFEDELVLDGVDMHLNPGENLAILGRSGVGKSVLAKCIVRLIEPDAGSIEVLGKDILSMGFNELNDIRKKIGFLFQGGALYDSMSVRENLEFPVRRTKRKPDTGELEAQVERVLRSMGLLDSIDKMPSELSGGMRKRISLARTLMLKPEIIIYDEPTTGLDSASAREVSELILKVQESYSAASIIITHDLLCAEITSDRVNVLANGKIVADGTYTEISQSKSRQVSIFFDKYL